MNELSGKSKVVERVFSATEEYLLKLGITPMPRILTDKGVRRVSRRKLVK